MYYGTVISLKISKKAVLILFFINLKNFILFPPQAKQIKLGRAALPF